MRTSLRSYLDNHLVGVYIATMIALAGFIVVHPFSILQLAMFVIILLTGFFLLLLRAGFKLKESAIVSYLVIPGITAAIALIATTIGWLF